MKATSKLVRNIKHRRPNKRLGLTGPGLAFSAILRRLTADISVIVGVSLRAPYEDCDTWVLKEAPLLDKKLLEFIETEPRAFEREYWDFPSCPESWDAFASSNPERWMKCGSSPDECSYPPLDDTNARHDSLAVWNLCAQFPKWLLPLLGAIFCPSSEDQKIKAIRSLHQLLVFGYKSEYEHTNEQLDEALKGFISTDSECLSWRAYFRSPICKTLLFNEARKIVGRVCANLDLKNITGRHGPGSVFPPRLPSDKSAFYSYYDTIRQYYGWSEHFIALPSFWEEEMRWNDSRFVELDRIVAKITPVPKDSRGPRLICVHPAEAIWIQMGQSERLCNAIERCPLTAGRISFTDQTVNGRLALESSLDRANCTIDLSEASDRVDSELVRFLFGETLYALLSCSRATHYVSPDGVVREMNKWAPMGNGLTFPVESLVFFALAHAGVQLKHGRAAMPNLYVFGDDIVCPTRYKQSVVDALQTGGLKVNHSKTFSEGFFRESCGVEAFKGHNITPLRVKKGWRLKTCANGVSICDLAKRLRIAGYHRTAAYLYSEIAVRWGPLPKSNNPNYTALYEYVDCDLVTLMGDLPMRHLWRTKDLKSSGCSFWNDRWHLWGIQARSVAGVKYTPAKHDWYHVQDSLVRLERNLSSHVGSVTKRSEVKYPLPLGSVSERGLAYPFPDRVRTCKGFIPHLSK